MADSFADIKALAGNDAPGDRSANRGMFDVRDKNVKSDDADDVEMVYDKLKSAKQGVMDWREDAEECDKFRAGYQWDNEDLELLRDQNRPAITFNRVHPIVEVVAGTEVTNRQEVRFVPRHPEMDGKNALGDMATNAVQWANDQCYADDERSSIFKDLVVRGMGWGEQFLDYEQELDGRYVMHRWDGMEAWWDTSARAQNLEDTRWRARKRWWRAKDIYEHWADKKDELDEAVASASSYTLYDDDFPTSIETVSPLHYMENNQTTIPGRPRGHWPLIQLQQYELEDVYRVVDPDDPDGPLKEYDSDQFKTLKERIESLKLQKRFPLDFVKQKRRVFYEYFVTKGVLLEKRKQAIQGDFTLKCMTAYWDAKKKVWYGLVRSMIEPQRAANKWLSQGLHIVNANAKGGLMIETGAVVNPRRFEAEWSMPDKISFLKDGALSGPNGPKVKEKSIPQFPPAIVTMIQYAIESLRDVTGVSIEMLGFSEGNTPGVSQRQRQAQGMVILAGLFSSLTRFRKSEALSTLEFVREYIADGRLIRVGGDYNAQSMPLLRDPLSVEYDLIVDESPRNPNVKMEVWGGLTQMAPILLKMNMFPPELLDYSPMPAVLTSRLKQRMEQAMQAAAQIPPKGWKDPKETMARIDKMKASAMLDVEKARQLDNEASFKKIELLLQTMMEEREQMGAQLGAAPSQSQSQDDTPNMSALLGL